MCYTLGKLVDMYEEEGVGVSLIEKLSGREREREKIQSHDAARLVFLWSEHSSAAGQVNKRIKNLQFIEFQLNGENDRELLKSFLFRVLHHHPISTN